MLCNRCGRLPGPTCSLCRTVERIRILAASPACTSPTTWSSTLRVLRETCGILLDISEENSGWSLGTSGGEVPPVAGVVETPTAVEPGLEGVTPKSKAAPPAEVRSDPEEEKEVPRAERREKKDKKEGRNVWLRHVRTRALLLLNRGPQRRLKRRDKANFVNLFK